MTYRPIQQIEEEDFNHTSAGEWDQAGALYDARPDQEWILSNRDCWYRNPAFTGTPGRHPEEDPEDWEDAPCNGPAYDEAAADFDPDLDIPF